MAIEELPGAPLFMTTMVYIPDMVTDMGPVDGQFLYLTRCLFKGCAFGKAFPEGNAPVESQNYIVTTCGHADCHHNKLLDHMIQHYDVMIAQN
jgi:hypothetical protein